MPDAGRWKLRTGNWKRETWDYSVADEMIFTADAVSQALALAEMVAAAPGCSLREWLAPGVGWVALPSEWVGLAAQLRLTPPIFCRHVCPVEVTTPLAQSMVDLATLEAVVEGFAGAFDRARPFSVQTRMLGEGWSFGPYDVNTVLAAQLEKSGAPLDVRAPVDVLSVVLTPERGHLGVSRTADNLSDWAGGARRFRRDPQQISRAEFKLLEALEVFGLAPSGGEHVLDLGAAPGGWTRVMRQQGARVVAVDPAEMAPALRRDPGVEHVRATAEDYLPSARVDFDVILNDIRMDARDSARIMETAREHLRPSGWGVMTLKLPRDNTKSTMDAALKVLRRSYRIIGVRQLFHNRSEVSVALRG
jgi:23S rRNA (cytidine2498-2'-O)-methyltransferase